MGRIIRRARRRHHHPQGQLNRRWDTLSGTHPCLKSSRFTVADATASRPKTLASSRAVPGIDLDRLLALRDT